MSGGVARVGVWWWGTAALLWVLPQCIAIAGDVAATPNPHWDKARCNACHGESGVAEGGGESLVAMGDGLCTECHGGGAAHAYIHPVAKDVPEPMKARMAELWTGDVRLDGEGRLTCLSCHDALEQCLPKHASHRATNRRFLRGGPYRQRYGLCYQCHDPERYQPLNSHTQIAGDGSVRVSRCRLCHEVRPGWEVSPGLERNLEAFPLLRGIGGDRTQLCVRCHRKIDHPSGGIRVRAENAFRHLVKIPDDKKRWLEEQVRERGVTLPLESGTGRVYCGTCHEVHQHGLFAGETAEAAPETQHRLRAKDLCRFCHSL